jgi:hypothetical protein
MTLAVWFAAIFAFLLLMAAFENIRQQLKRIADALEKRRERDA